MNSTSATSEFFDTHWTRVLWRRRCWHGACSRLVGCLLVLAVANDAARGAEVDFALEVLPLLREHCLDCHGAETAEADLRLDSVLHALRGGNSGERVIRPGASDKSHLIERITHQDPGQRMPPESEPLSAEQVSLLKKWVDDVGAWQAAEATIASSSLDHWSFKPVVRPQVPDNGEPQPIDAFIKRKLAEQQLSFSPQASRRQLIRRLYLVMHGLPPTPAAVQQFENDSSPDAWRNLVESVLASPSYGERWGTYWLDLARFGETHGFETNRERPNAWRYRDWVINALNEDKPYDEFVREQIAGDAYGEGLGTGFLVAGPYDLVKGQDKLLQLTQRQDELADMINTTGTAFLGLTLGCARCHNHKFDPVSQTDYYAMQAVFAGVNHADRTLPLPKDATSRLDELDGEIADLKLGLRRFIRQARFAHLLLDDEQLGDRGSVGVEYLREPAGRGTNPAGTGAGFAADSGDAERSANLSGGSYTWWENDPGKDLAVYRPFAHGRYRVWLSWGAGWETHTKDARYYLDRDGDPTTQEDRLLIAEVNQKYLTSGEKGVLFKKPLWSGFYDAGIHELTSTNAIVLQGGETGTAVTTDVLLLEPVLEEAAAQAASQDVRQASKPSLRPAVNAKLNEERFPETEAKFVRFTINATSASQPCIDELEVFSGDTNVALASAGAKPTSSGDFKHALHKLAHINDGQYGNARSWISAVVSGGWVQIEFPQIAMIDRILWARDRDGGYADRVATDYIIEVSLDGQQWRAIATSADRITAKSQAATTVYDFSTASAADAAEAQSQLAHLTVLQRSREDLSRPVAAYIGTFSQPGPTHRLYRGDPTTPRERVSPGAIESLANVQLSDDSPEQQRRQAIAEWITHPENPLTARVMVNRLWQHHFGTAIVDTPSDFGGNGSKPTHPELLDWLAAEFVAQKWSVKQMHREILLSRSWQQNSQPVASGMSVDADARLLWRFPPRRLEAEAIRDSILTVTAQLRPAMGGPGFSAFEVEMENVRHFFPKKDYGPDDWRRMVYMTKVRQERDSVFGVFDCPDFNQVVPKRSRSTTPLQALNLLNSRFVMQQAGFMAERLEAVEGSDADRVRAAYSWCYSRPAADDEVTAALQFVEESGWVEFSRVLLNSNEFVFVP